MVRTLFIHFGITCLLLPSAFAQTPAPMAKVARYAVTFINRHDTNNDGILQQEEWEKLPGTPRAIDIDGDGQIALDELIRYFTDYGQGRTIHRTIVIDRSTPVPFNRDNRRLFRPFWQRTDTPSVAPSETQEPPDVSMEEMMIANEEPVDDDVYQRLLEERQIPTSRPYHVIPAQLRGVPRWFIILDKNGDGQVTLAEFAPTLAPATVKNFERFDKNGNGIIEPDEVRSVSTSTTTGGNTIGTAASASE